jgi:hypothetical protein
VQDLEAGSRIVSIGYIGAVNCVGAIPADSPPTSSRPQEGDKHRKTAHCFFSLVGETDTDTLPHDPGDIAGDRS